jgi:hypothetical protein
MDRNLILYCSATGDFARILLRPKHAWRNLRAFSVNRLDVCIAPLFAVDWRCQRSRIRVRVVRLIPDDSGFGLGNPGYKFGLSIAACGWTAACVTFVAGGFSPPSVYFSGDIDKVTRRYSRRLNLLSRSEIIIGSEIKTGVSQSETGVIRNQTHHS